MTMRLGFTFLLLFLASSNHVAKAGKSCDLLDLMNDCRDSVVEIVDAENSVTLGEEEEFLKDECGDQHGMHAAKCLMIYICKTHGQEPVDKLYECIQGVCPTAKHLAGLSCAAETGEEVKEVVEEEIKEVNTGEVQAGQGKEVEDEDVVEAVEEQKKVFTTAKNKPSNNGHHFYLLFIPVAGLLLYAVSYTKLKERGMLEYLPSSSKYSGIVLSTVTGREYDSSAFHDSYHDEPEGDQNTDAEYGESAEKS